MENFLKDDRFNYDLKYSINFYKDANYDRLI